MPAATRFLVVLFLLACLLLPTLAAPAASLNFADELRAWTAEAPGRQPVHYFRLDWSEEYTDYVLHIEPGDDVPAAVGHVEVQDLNLDVVCSGPVTYSAGVLSVLRQCPDLNVMHYYRVLWIADRPGTTLFLSGFDRINA